MNRITLKIDGMMCGKCEQHMNEAIKNAVPGAKKISSSHEKGTTEFLTDSEPDMETIGAAVAEAGYTLVSSETETGVKKGLFGFGSR